MKIFQTIKEHLQGKVPIGTKRSSHWPAIRKAFLEGRKCAVCGGTKKLEAHHKVPFHLHAELELDPSNLIALCEGPWQCHLIFGHLRNFRGYNPEVELDTAKWRAKFAANRSRISG